MRWLRVPLLVVLSMACSKPTATDAGPPTAPATTTPTSLALTAPTAPSAQNGAEAPTTVPTESARATAMPRTDPADAGPDLPDDPKASFVENRVRRAKVGVTEIVSMRVWHCGPSCTCPPPCIRTEDGAMNWIDLVDADGKAVPLADWANAEVVGQFTGRTRKATGPSPEEHQLPELRIIGAPTVLGTAMAPELEGARSKVVLSGAAAAKSVAKVRDDRPYLVVVGSFALSDAQRSEVDAQKLLQKVQDAGFPDAERYDSRAFSSLACCFDIVLGGRFADAKGAEVRKNALAAKGIKAYVKKGF